MDEQKQEQGKPNPPQQPIQMPKAEERELLTDQTWDARWRE